jgi:hypothetical protein
MSRLRLGLVLGCLCFFAAAVCADQFWKSKDWRHWSEEECKSLLQHSPWSVEASVQGPLQREPQIQDAAGTLPQIPQAPPTPPEIYYVVQLRSAMPIREAIVRQYQLRQKYDQMTESQRASFDSQAGQILNRDYSDLILVHVEFVAAYATMHGTGFQFRQINSSIQALLKSLGDDATTLNACLVPDHADCIRPIRLIFTEKQPDSFELLFPRAIQGKPLITDANVRLTFQFQSPSVLQIPSRHVDFFFDLKAMELDGKRVF